MTGWRPKFVVLDLDGTVVPVDPRLASPSPRVRAAVAATLAAGVPVTVATGRASWGAMPTVTELGLDGRTGGPSLVIACANGAVSYDVAAREVVREELFDPRPAAEALLAREPALGIAVERGWSGTDQSTTPGYWHNRHFRRDFASAFVAEVPLDVLLAAPAARMVCRRPGDDANADHTGDRMAAAQRLVVDAGLDPARYTCEVGHAGWIDITGAGVSKASAAALLARDLGIDPADVLAVGDGNNDLALFAWAGRSVAMGQAPAEVRAAADEVTAPVAADGVAVVLERYFP